MNSSSRDISNLETGDKVRAIDAAIREIRQGTNFPWNLVKGTLRIFSDIYEYPITADHDEIAYLDKQNLSKYEDTARMYNTSLQQFYENVSANRNLLADIWKDGTRMIGVRENTMGLGSATLDSSDDSSKYTLTGDASTPTEDEVNTKIGSSSIKFVITNATGIANIYNTVAVSSDVDYQKKYHFRYIYLDAVPTSIEMRLEKDGSNYLSKTLTAQFSGEAFKADDWNLIGYDLNEATETGTFDGTSIAGERLIITGGSTGTYYLSQSSLKTWKLLDKWYYSKYNVITSDATTPDKEFFIGTSESTADIDTSDKLLGDAKWFDLVSWTAAERLIADINNPTVFSFIMRKKTEAMKKFNAKYPSMTPLITTKRRNFNNDPLYSYLNNPHDD